MKGISKPTLVYDRFTFTAPSSWSATTPWCSCLKFLACFLVYFVFCSALRIVVDPSSYPHHHPKFPRSRPPSSSLPSVLVSIFVVVWLGCGCECGCGWGSFVKCLGFVWVYWVNSWKNAGICLWSFSSVRLCSFLFCLVLFFFAGRSECTWCIKIAYGVLNFLRFSVGFPKMSVRVCRDKGWTGDYDFFSGTPNYVRSAGNRWRSTGLALSVSSPKYLGLEFCSRWEPNLGVKYDTLGWCYWFRDYNQVL